ncbi:MAG: DUF4870 family protein [Gammaproteobacteria bacterium]
MNNQPVPHDARAQDKRFVAILYGLQALGLVVGLTFLVALVLAYLRREEIGDERLRSHLSWQISTFWWGLLWNLVAGLTVWLFGLGVVLGALVWLWVLYRVVRGLLRLNAGSDI